MELIELTTKDGVGLAVDYYAPTEKSQKGVILLHMMPATRESWRELAPQLAENGYHVIAPDLRGHGESEGGPNGYEEFSNEEHQASTQDVEEVYAFLQKQNTSHSERSKPRPQSGRGKESDQRDPSAMPQDDNDSTLSEIAVVGASIGANLAIQFMAEHPEVSAGVFLSPGLDYKGLKTLPLVKQFHAEQKALFVASRDDERCGNPAPGASLAYRQAGGTGCVAVNEELMAAVPDVAEKRLIAYDSAGHGTDMFGKEGPDLAVEILRWLE